MTNWTEIKDPNDQECLPDHGKHVLCIIKSCASGKEIPACLFRVNEDDCNWRCVEGGLHEPELSHDWDVIRWMYVPGGEG